MYTTKWCPVSYKTWLRIDYKNDMQLFTILYVYNINLIF